MCTFWPPFFYTTLGGAGEPTVSALRSAYNMFWWVWLLLGWMPTLIMSLEFDSKYGNGYDMKLTGKGGKTAWLVAGEAGLWCFTFLVMFLYRGPLSDFYNKARYREAAKLMFVVDVMKNDPDYKGPLIQDASIKSGDEAASKKEAVSNVNEVGTSGEDEIESGGDSDWTDEEPAPDDDWSLF